MTAAERLITRALLAVTAVATAALVTVHEQAGASTTGAPAALVSVVRSTGEPAPPPTAPRAAVPPVKPAGPAVTKAVTVKRAPKPAARPAARPAAKPAVSAAELHRTGCDGTSGWVQRRGAYALSTLSYDWKQLDYDIVFLPARNGITGMTWMRAHRIEIYVRSCTRTTLARLAETIAHELGHAIDFSRGTDTWRQQWQVARHIPLSVPWYGANGVSDFDTPAGDFAESFAAWQVPAGPNDSRWGRPSPEALRTLVPLMTI